MSNVFSIETMEPLDPQKDVITMLENLLADARAGYLVAAAVATVMPDGGTGFAIHAGVHQTALTASTALLAHRVMAGGV